MASQKQSTRRGFLKQSAAVGAGFWVAGGVASTARAQANSQLQIAKIGVSGKGRSDMTYAMRFGKIHAVCDVDRRLLEPAARARKTEHKFTDYREMLDKLGDQIDVVIISTPDHTHAVMAGKAMRMKKHVYVQKPLTHTIWEARELARIAREMGVVTQMGNQYTALPAMRQAAARIRAGQVGKVTDVYVWTNRPIWPQGLERPASAPVPKEVDWEAWIGPAPMRDYADAAYHDFRWRGWWDFGTGSLGDMACHTCNLPFMALNMRNPTAVEASSSPNNKDSYPATSKIEFDFPELDGRPAFKLHWSDKSQLPPEELYAEFLRKPAADGKPRKLSDSGALIVGDKCTMYAAGDYAQQGIELSGGTEWIDAEYPHAPNESADSDLCERSHVEEFYNAIHDPKQAPTSNIPDYSGPFTETILLGNLAVWKGGRVEWNAETLTADDPSLAKVVKPEYRDGYEV
ncbi:MAG TPA: Gfo/Idh/MocA family oxidoreductase [Lacipirellulaceae bacterium]|nr:Gfo/Idh/MocA family oxidoreductase [Lacipirellulaceae bacterium]